MDPPKEEMKRRRAPDYGLDRIFPLTEFIRTYVARHPNAVNLADLTVEDIDEFTRQSCTRSDGDWRPTQSVYMKLSAIRTFLTFVLEEDPALLPVTFQPRWLQSAQACVGFTCWPAYRRESVPSLFSCLVTT
jgi:hypothetical protein